MTKNTMRIGAFFLFVIFGFSAFAASLTEQQKITALLDRLGTSGVIFIRHGKEYDAANAKIFFSEKLKNTTPPVATAKDFITNVGTGGQTTHQPFFFKLKDGTTVSSGQWFTDQLTIIQKTKAKK